MRVLIASAEAVPFAKVGGMGDVVGSLPIALKQLGVDARIIMPGYGFLFSDHQTIEPFFCFRIPYDDKAVVAEVYRAEHRGVTFYFVRAHPFFGESGSVYTPDIHWDIPRFIIFSKLVLATIEALDREWQWLPDVIQINDWHTGLIPYLLKQQDKIKPRPVCNITIHNNAYQGEEAGQHFDAFDLEPPDHDWLQRHDLTENMLAIGVAYADSVNTVSPTYAKEMKAGDPKVDALVPLYQARQDQLCGILNGLDTIAWNPATDPNLQQNYSQQDAAVGKMINKRALQQRAGLKCDNGALLLGMVSRLVEQKGVDFTSEAVSLLLSGRNAQLVVLGTGNPEYEEDLEKLQERFPGRVRIWIDFDEALSRQIYAGCDAFLMPSRFEPCGMGQMMAMRYGTLPIARSTGGLADTIKDFAEDDGVGFLFQNCDAHDFFIALEHAYDTFKMRPSYWQAMQKRAMILDFSWKQSALQYLNLYQQTISTVAEGVPN